VLEPVPEASPPVLPPAAREAAPAPLASLAVPATNTREHKRQVSRWVRRGLFTLVALGAVGATPPAVGAPPGPGASGGGGPPKKNQTQKKIGPP
jgi:hypothetical protein